MPTKQLVRDEIYCTCGFRRGWTLDEKGWWVCAVCRKPSIFTLNECDICDKLHRDGMQHFPYATTCKECEDKL